MSKTEVVITLKFEVWHENRDTSAVIDPVKITEHWASAARVWVDDCDEIEYEGAIVHTHTDVQWKSL